MRIVVFSDSHNNEYILNELVKKNETADMFIFLGDGIADFDSLRKKFPKKKFESVCGNCDVDYSQPSTYERILRVRDYKIFITHGHLYSVTSNETALLRRANTLGADIALYGHTHIASVGYHHGIHIMNPGSVSKSRRGKNSYGYIDINDDNVFLAVVEIN